MMKNLFILGVVTLIAFSCNNANVLPTEEAVKDVLVLTQKAMEVPSIANELNVELKHNIETEVVIPDTVKWVVFSQSKSTTTSYLNFKIEKNTTTVKRVAKITVQQKGGELKDVLVIEQKGADQESPSSGGLNPILAAMTLIAADTTTSLTIKGAMSDEDFKFIKYKMPDLQHLDISEAIPPNNTIPINALGTLGGYGAAKPLHSIKLPLSTIKIGTGAFVSDSINEGGLGGTRKIGDLTKLKYLECIEREAFMCYRRYNLAYPESVRFPESLKHIGERSFLNRPIIGELIIPDNVIFIGDGAFSFCNISSLKIGRSVSVIRALAFYSCTQLTGELVIPTNVLNIGERAFYSCSNITRIKVSWNVPIKYKRDMIPRNVYSNNTPFPIPLYVPMASVDLYKAADGWKDHQIIGY